MPFPFYVETYNFHATLQKKSNSTKVSNFPYSSCVFVSYLFEQKTTVTGLHSICTQELEHANDATTQPNAKITCYRKEPQLKEDHSV